MTWTKDRLINGTLGEGVESKLLGYVKRAVLPPPQPAKVQNLFPDPDEEVTLVIAAAKKEKELCETRQDEETARSASSAVASAPSSSVASAPRASVSDLQPRLQAQKELPKTLNAAGEDGLDADTGADASHAAALETGKRKNGNEDAGQGIDHLRAVQARLFPFKMFPVCAVVVCVSFLRALLSRHSLTQLWPAFSCSYSGGGRIETGNREPGRPKKQKEHVDKSTGSHNKDRGGDKERAMDEKGCGKRAAEDDSGDAHLSGEGHKKKQSLS